MFFSVIAVQIVGLTPTMVRKVSFLLFCISRKLKIFHVWLEIALKWNYVIFFCFLFVLFCFYFVLLYLQLFALMMLNRLGTVSPSDLQ